MRNLLREIGAAFRRMREMMSSVARFAYDAVDEGSSWVMDWFSFRRQPHVPEIEDYEIDVPEPSAQTELDEGSLRLIGSQAVRAAKEMLQTGDVRSSDIDPVVAAWARSLEHDDLWTVSGASELDAGRHVAGLSPLRSPEGFPLRHPDPEEDAERIKKRRRLREEQEAINRAAYARVERERRQERELTPDAPALRLVA